MVDTLWNKISPKNPFHENVNNLIGSIGIKAKTIGEDLGIWNTNSFTNFGSYKT